MSEKDYDQQEVRDHILVLIDADNFPVRGKTLFMYKMFMILKEVSPELQIPFFPYQFGPYSNAVAHECNWLIDNKLITASKKGRAWVFEMTDKGKSFVSSITISKEKKDEISLVKKTTHDLGLQATIEFTKNKYPKYFINSRV